MAGAFLPTYGYRRDRPGRQSVWPWAC